MVTDRRSVTLNILGALCLGNALGAEHRAAGVVLEPYQDPEAYEVYAALFPKERFSKGDYRPVILRETHPAPFFEPIRKCLSTSDFLLHWPLVVDFEKVNQETRLLAPERLHLNGPYDLVSKGEIEQFFMGGKGWEDFYRRFPKSRGYDAVSRVGFNWGESEALVYSENVCGGLCGGGSYHYFEKRNGKWQEVFDRVAIACRWVS
jgi:hypothetical protein